MISSLKRHLLDKWENLELGRKPEDLLFIKFSDRRIRSAEVSIISFLVKKIQRGQEEPLLILRFPRYYANKEANLSLELEYQNLNLIQDKLKSSDIQRSIPKSIFWERINENRVLALEFLHGEALSKNMLYGNIFDNYVKNFTLAFEWSTNFQKGIGCSKEASAADLVKDVVALYASTFPEKVAGQQRYFSRLQGLSQKLARDKLPLFAQHGDFHAENIFVADDKVTGIIDWEEFKLHGIPGFDVFHFIRTYFEALFQAFAEIGEFSLIEKISSENEVLKLVRDSAESYFQKVGIDPEFMQIFLPLYLIQSANLAGSPRKKAVGALTKLEILLLLAPFSLEDLLLYLSFFAFRNLSKKAAGEGNKELVNLCQEKIKKIQEVSKSKQQG